MSKKSRNTRTSQRGTRKKIVSLEQYESQPQEAPAAVEDEVAAAVISSEKKRSSGLDAVARVLRESGTAMNTAEMVKIALEKGYWTTGGKTPAATIYSAIVREITVKGEASRFRKTQRGHFELTDAGRQPS